MAVETPTNAIAGNKDPALGNDVDDDKSLDEVPTNGTAEDLTAASDTADELDAQDEEIEAPTTQAQPQKKTQQKENACNLQRPKEEFR